MLREEMYEFEQIRIRVESLGIPGKIIATNMIQLGEKKTTIHRKKTGDVILYATDSDFDKISGTGKLTENRIVIPGELYSKEELESAIRLLSNNEKSIICIRKGNKVLHATSAGKYNPHEIILFSKDNFDVVFEMLTGSKM